MKEFYIILLTILIASQSLAHGDLHEMIKKVSKEIKSSPDSAFLYLKRGELYFQHEDFKESIEDYTSCSKLGYDNPRLYFAFAKTYDRIENYNFALSYIDKILIDNALNINALRLKGQILCRTKQYLSAAESFEKVLKFADKTFPENYMETSLAWENSNRKDALKKASNCIYQGINDLGELLVFYNRLIELHLKFYDYESALFYQTKVLEFSNRKESAYYQRAMIYLEKGEINNAKIDLKRSLSAIDQLPLRIKRNKAMYGLKVQAQKALERL